MTLLAIYWSPSLFWWVYVPFLVLCGYWMYRSLSYRGPDSIFDVIAFIVIIFFTIAGMILCFQEPPEWRTEEVRKEIDKILTAQEERYYGIKFLGKKEVIYNPPDNMRYVRMGGGRMIGCHVITSNKMCRACGQFNDTAYVDSMYVYSATTSDREWFNEPKLYFSEQPDLVFEEMMDLEVK